MKPILISFLICFLIQYFCEGFNSIKISHRSGIVKSSLLTLNKFKHSYKSSKNVLKNSLGNDTEKKSNIYSIPNMLTISRIFMIPIFMLAFAFQKRSVYVATYIVSCITDFFDGYLARKWDQMSAFGKFLDPVADKLMVSVALILLICQVPKAWFAIPATIIIGREISVSALREWMAGKKLQDTVQVGFLGKVKTATQMISTILLLIASPGVFDFELLKSFVMSKSYLFWGGVLLLYISTFLTLVSGIQYFSAAWPNLLNDNDNN